MLESPKKPVIGEKLTRSSARQSLRESMSIKDGPLIESFLDDIFGLDDEITIAALLNDAYNLHIGERM